MADLRVRTRKLGSFMSFRPTINLLVDFLHRLSLEATGDPAQNMQGGRCGAICKRWSGSAGWEIPAEGVAPAPPRCVLREARGCSAPRSSGMSARGLRQSDAYYPVPNLR